MHMYSTYVLIMFWCFGFTWIHLDSLWIHLDCDISLDILRLDTGIHNFFWWILFLRHIASIYGRLEEFCRKLCSLYTDYSQKFSLFPIFPYIFHIKNEEIAELQIPAESEIKHGYHQFFFSFWCWNGIGNIWVYLYRIL